MPIRAGTKWQSKKRLTDMSSAYCREDEPGVTSGDADEGRAARKTGHTSLHLPPRRHRGKICFGIFSAAGIPVSYRKEMTLGAGEARRDSSGLRVR